MDSIERLTDLLTAMGDDEEDCSRWTACIGRLEQVDSSFSEDAANLIESTRSVDVRQIIKMWVSAPHRINSAEDTSSWVSRKSGRDYTAARYILEDAVIAGSLAYEDTKATRAIPEVRRGHQLMLVAAPHLIPDLLTSGSTEIDRYCHPLKVAASILQAESNEQYFKDEAPAFITWSSSQPDLDSVLSAALRINSLDPEAITEFQAHLKNTHVALHDGLI